MLELAEAAEIPEQNRKFTLFKELLKVFIGGHIGKGQIKNGMSFAV